MATVINCISLHGYTLLKYKGELPIKNWNKLKIDGVIYEPIPAYDLECTVAIKGEYDYAGREIEFIRQ